MSQPPYPYGQPGPDPQGGNQPPSYPPPPQPSSGGAYQGGGHEAPGGYPPPPAGGYSPQPGAYPPPPGGPPGGGYPGQPGAPGQQPYAVPPKKKGGALKVVLIVLGVVLLLCIAGGVFAFIKGKDKVEDVVAASKISVTEPAQLGGRDKVTDPSLQSTVESLDTEMKNIKGTTSSVGAIYGDLEKQDVVLIAAASTLQGTAQSRYDEFTQGMNTGGFSTEKLTDTDPGPLGGIAKCGESSQASVKMAVCVWSDNGSTGMFAMLFKSKADLEKEFVTLRGEVEKKA